MNSLKIPAVRWLKVMAAGLLIFLSIGCSKQETLLEIRSHAGNTFQVIADSDTGFGWQFRLEAKSTNGDLLHTAYLLNVPPDFSGKFYLTEKDSAIMLERDSPGIGSQSRTYVTTIWPDDLKKH